MQLPVFDLAGKEASSLSLPEGLFEKPINRTALHEVVRAQRARRRSGTATVKGRASVRGSSKKLGRQKGGGRARHGSVRAPSFVGGGVVHGPQLRSMGFTPPKRVRALALESAIKDKLERGALRIVAGLEGIAPKTKAGVELLRNLGVDQGKAALVSDATVSPALERSLRNLPRVDLMASAGLNPYDVLRHRHLVMSKVAFEGLCESLLRRLVRKSHEAQAAA